MLGTKLCTAQSDAHTCIGTGEHHGELPFLHIRECLVLSQRRRPVSGNVDMRDRPPKTPRLVVVDEAGAQRHQRSRLKGRVKRRAHGKPAVIESRLAILPRDFPAHFLNEIVCLCHDGVFGLRLNPERSRHHVACLRGANEAVALHLANHPVAPADRAFGMPVRVVVVGSLRQGSETLPRQRSAR